MIVFIMMSHIVPIIGIVQISDISIAEHREINIHIILMSMQNYSTRIQKNHKNNNKPIQTAHWMAVKAAALWSGWAGKGLF